MEIEESNKKKFIEFVNTYSKNNEPIEVNFRDLVKESNQTDRATHIIHTYPAKLIFCIPYFFLNNNYFGKSGDSVLDPFCGSGTVLLESILSNKRAFGSDANPLARLITKVKTSNYSIEELKESQKKIDVYINSSPRLNRKYPDVVNIDYWFLPKVKKQLLRILDGINIIEEKSLRDFFLLCFSNCIKKVSLADNRVSVPVRIKVDSFPKEHPQRKKNIAKLESLKKIDVYKKFNEIVENNIKRFEIKKLNFSNNYTATIVSNDARNLNLKNQSIDLIISSPPYAGAQKYIRSSSLNICWTELANAKNLRFLDSKNIGRENYRRKEYIKLIQTGIPEADDLLKIIYKQNSLRAHIAANYLIEMEQAIKEAYRVLKKDKFFVLIAANNQICGYEFKTQEYLRQIAESIGFETTCRLIDNIKSYGLMTKRNKTASIITCEWVLILKKCKNG